MFSRELLLSKAKLMQFVLMSLMEHLLSVSSLCIISYETVAYYDALLCRLVLLIYIFGCFQEVTTVPSKTPSNSDITRSEAAPPEPSPPDSGG